MPDFQLSTIMKLPWHRKKNLPLVSSLKNEAPNLAALQLEILIKNLSDGVIIYGPDFKINFINRAAEQMLGVKNEEVSGKIISPALLQDERLRALTQIIFPALAPIVTQVSEDEWPQIVDIALEEPQLKLRATLNRITGQENTPLSFIKVLRDRTREENILASKREFLDTAAHQLRTPLTAMSWAFETFVKEIQNNPGLKTTAEEGLGLAKKSIKIVDDLLNAARIEGGQFGYKFQETDIVNFIKEIVGQAKTIAEQANIKVTFTSAENSLKATIDTERLGIALTNLIDNAIKYNNVNGSVAVTLEKETDLKFIKISIQDTGVGVPQNEINKMFTKFYRGSNIIQLEPNGSGLGLYITRNIIRNHGGEIYVDSVPGRGTKFWFTLPTDPSLIPLKETVHDPE